MFFPFRSSLSIACAAALLAVSTASLAGLGGNQDTMRGDQESLGAPFEKTVARNFSLYALTTPDGVRVREYVKASGLVFAVAWDGPVLPDLEILLGSSFPAYREALRPRIRSIQIRQSGLVIESSGMMRAFKGRAFLADQLPSGVAAGEIQ